MEPDERNPSTQPGDPAPEEDVPEQTDEFAVPTQSTPTQPTEPEPSTQPGDSAPEEDVPEQTDEFAVPTQSTQTEPTEPEPSTQPGDSAPEEDVPEQTNELAPNTGPSVGAEPLPPNGWSSGFDADPSSQQPDHDDLPGGSDIAAAAIADSPETSAAAPVHEPRAEDLQAEAPIDVTAPNDLDEAAPSQPAPIDLPWPSAAETPAAGTDAAAWSMGADRSGSSGWGALWRQSAQGWVEDPAGRAVWRPIVTTSATLSEWEVDTYLGLVTGDLAISADDLEAALSAARQVAVERMVDDALARGAHAVIGVSVDLVEVAERVVVSAAGTAVTLKTSE